MNWIKVEDQLPEDISYVLCWSPEMEHPIPARAIFDSIDTYIRDEVINGVLTLETTETTVLSWWRPVYYSESSCWKRIKQVTHWMPLPSPPKEKANE